MSKEDLIVDESAVARIEALRRKQGRAQLRLRVTVEGGGCSGFQYQLALTDAVNADERIFRDSVVTDDISLPFLLGATVSFEESLVGAAFKITNPNAVAGCGCGTSFAV